MEKLKSNQDGFTATTAEAKKEREQEIKAKEAKKAKKKDGKPGFFKRIGLKLKDVFSELKRVTWPAFPKVVKKTGVVLVVVLAFLVIITAFDTGLLKLLGIVSPS
nr:preprotein translocase subunit SecE [Clostridia bacterium]